MSEKSLVEWAIDCALTVFTENQIVLVTDSEKSKETGLQSGVEVLRRPAKISTSSSSSESVIKFVMKHYPSEICFVAAKLVRLGYVSDLIACIDQFEKSSARSIMSVTLHGVPLKIYMPLQ